MPDVKQTRRYQNRSPVRFALVAELDVPNVRARVTFPDRGQMQSWWLKICVRNTQNNKDFWMPDVGEQVACLMDERDEAGVILGSIYSTADTPPAGMTGDKQHVTFKDAAQIEYDRSGHILKHTAQDGTMIKYDAGAHVLTIALPIGATLDFSVGGSDGTVMTVDADGDFTWYSIATAALYGKAAMTLGSDHDVQLLTGLFSTSIDQIVTALNSVINLLKTAVASGTGISGTPDPIT